MKLFTNTQQEIVLKEIQVYLNKNKTLELDKVIPYIRNAFSRTSVNINDNGIKNIIKLLIENRYIIEGSKLTKEKILQNNNRKKIYDFIKQNPGILSYDIMRNIKLGPRVVAWHLEILCKFDCIKKIKIENHNVFFHPKVKKSCYLPLYLLSKKKIKNIIYYMNEMNDSGVTKTNISNDLGIDYRTVSKYFDSLEDAGILFITDKLSRKKKYCFSKKYYNYLQNFK